MGRVVKGIQFTDLKDAGDPVATAKCYEENGADELCFLDITASPEKRKIVKDLVLHIASEIFIPFTVGGGLRTLEDIECILHAGADKVSLNTAAFHRPKLLTEAAEHFGSQCIVCAVDSRLTSSSPLPFYEVFLNGGRTPTGRDTIDWVKEASDRGAGEILLTSMDRDGTKDGYDLELLQKIRDSIDLPVIASGGAGKIEHLCEAVEIGGADAVLAASIFHFGMCSIMEVKEQMAKKGIPIRLNERITQEEDSKTQ